MPAVDGEVKNLDMRCLCAKIRHNAMRLTPVFLLSGFVCCLGNAAVLQTAYFNGHTYHLLERSLWPEAEAEAVYLGGHLATIESQTENNFVLETFGPTATAHYPNMNVSLWIGLSDAQEEGRFVWASGSSASFSNWASGQPQGGVSDEDYVGIFVTFGSPGKWHDLVSDYRAGDTPLGVVEIGGEISSSTIRVSARSGPWDYSDVANASYKYGVDDHQNPAGVNVAAGESVTITAVGFCDADGLGSYYGDISPDGYSGAIASAQVGTSGEHFPSLYTPEYYPTPLLSLIGCFASADGVLVSNPFEVGSGPLTVEVPSGATRLQLGVNDDIYSDNTGEFVATVERSMRTATLEILGAATVAENSTNRYQCMVNYLGGTSSNVSAYAQWSMVEDWATAAGFRFENEAKLVTGPLCAESTNITIRASYSGLTTSRGVMVTNVPPAVTLGLAEHPVADAKKAAGDLGAFRQEYYGGQTVRLSVAVECAESSELTVRFEAARVSDISSTVMTNEVSASFPAGNTTTNMEWNIAAGMSPGWYAFRATARESCNTNVVAQLAWGLPELRIHVCRGNPVILVHGIKSSPGDCWGSMELLLQESNDLATVSFDYSGMTDTSGEAARIENIAAALVGKQSKIRDADGLEIDGSDIWVNSACYTTQYFGVSKVDVVAHSMGGLVTRAYMAGMARDGSTPVPYGGEIDKIVTLGSPFYGGLNRLTDAGGMITRWAEGMWPNARGLPARQVTQLDWGSQFFWDLHTIGTGYGSHLAVAGDVSLFARHDGVVDAASACAVNLTGGTRVASGFGHTALFGFPIASPPTPPEYLAGAVPHAPYFLTTQFLTGTALSHGDEFVAAWRDKSHFMIVATNATGERIPCWFRLLDENNQEVKAALSHAWHWESHIHGYVRRLQGSFRLEAIPVHPYVTQYAPAFRPVSLDGNHVEFIELRLERGADSDADDMPDGYEQRFFGNLSQGPADDTDHDGVNNYWEMAMGTDPADKTSCFKIAGSSVESAGGGQPSPRLSGVEKGSGDPGGQFVVQFDAVPGLAYELVSRDALLASDWIPVSEVITNASGQTVLADREATSAQKFYRLKVWMP